MSLEMKKSDKPQSCIGCNGSIISGTVYLNAREDYPEIHELPICTDCIDQAIIDLYQLRKGAMTPHTLS